MMSVDVNKLDSLLCGDWISIYPEINRHFVGIADGEFVFVDTFDPGGGRWVRSLTLYVTENGTIVSHDLRHHVPIEIRDMYVRETVEFVNKLYGIFDMYGLLV